MFFVFILQPTLRGAGPAGGTVMGKLGSGRFPVVIVITNLLTVAAGLTMVGIDSKGFHASWFLNPGPLTLTAGATFGILASAVGVFVQFPTLARIVALQKQIQQSGGQPTPEQLAELQKQQARFSNASRWAVALMVLAVIGMESARELGSLD